MSQGSLFYKLTRYYSERQKRKQLRKLLHQAYQEYITSGLELSQEFYAAEQEVWDKYVPWQPNTHS